MPAIPVVWSLESRTIQSWNPPPAYPEIYVGTTHSAGRFWEIPYTMWPRTVTGTQHDFTLYEHKQPAGPETLLDEPFGNSSNDWTEESYFVRVDGPSEAGASPNDISYSPSSFPVYSPVNSSNVSTRINGTITIPDVEKSFEVRIAAQNAGADGLHDTRSRWFWSAFIPAFGGGVRIQRTGNTYTFKGGSFLSGRLPTPDGYGATMFFEQGGTVQQIAGTRNPQHDDEGSMIYSLTKTYTGSNPAIYVWFQDIYGRRTPRKRVYLKALPRVSWRQSTSDEYVVIADGSDSFAPASTITGYAWSSPVEAALDAQGDIVSGGIISTYATSTPRARLRVPEVDGDGEYFSAELGLSILSPDDVPSDVFSNSYSYGAGRNYILPIDNRNTIDAVQMPDGSTVLARNQYGYLAIHRMEADQTEGDLRHALNGLSRPRLTIHRDGRIVMLVRDDATKHFKRRESHDRGGTWQ